MSHSPVGDRCIIVNCQGQCCGGEPAQAQKVLHLACIFWDALPATCFKIDTTRAPRKANLELAFARTLAYDGDIQVPSTLAAPRLPGE